MAEMVIFDVVEAILLRCLVIDLLRCKSVCKSWCSLISSSSFAKTHANKEEHSISRRIAKINPWVSSSLCRSSVPIEWRDYNKWFLAGSSNGLVGLFSQTRICVTNPLTRVFRVFENPPKFPEGAPFQLCLGFGYDSCGHDYKVVMAITKRNDRAVVHVLSLKSNIWKHFEVNYRFHDGALAKPGIFFNGALHWFWYDAIDTKVLLVSFNLATEKFREIPQPADDTRYVWDFNSTLGIIKGHLCIFHKRRDDGLPYCIWVMKKYNYWELLPNDCEIKDHAIHYMLKDNIQSSVLPTYYCDDNTQPSRDAKYIASPIFVQTLLSPYLNRNGRPRRKKNNTGRPNLTDKKESTIDTGRPSLTENNKSTVDNAWCPSHSKNSTIGNARSLSHPKNNESTVDNIASPSHPKNSTVDNARSPSHPKNNESTVKAASSVKENREIEEVYCMEDRELEEEEEYGNKKHVSKEKGECSNPSGRRGEWNKNKSLYGDCFCVL